ncbi:MAG: hypothetical protein JOY59_10610 [Candidatus Eremiobacteraeota bacterium]|nr:hypothetical protein [Candidatus Eremiobacteraeota bacterium]
MAERVPFAASAIGSFWWEGGLLLKRSLAHQGIELDLDDRVADYNNVLSVASGKNLMGITMPSFVTWSQRRIGIFADRDVPELRVIAALNLPVWLAAAVDRASGFETLAELARARYPWRVVLPPPHNQIGVYIERIMREHGLTRENIVSWGGADLRPTRSRTPEQQAARERSTERAVLATHTAQIARDGTTNGFFLYVNGQSAWGRDLTTLLDLRFLRFDEAILDRIIAEWGGTKMNLPARLFQGVDDDLPAVGWRHHYIYGKPDVPDELVRAVLHALEDERILENGHGFSYSALPPQLEPGLKLHRATEAYFAARQAV